MFSLNVPRARVRPLYLSSPSPPFRHAPPVRSRLRALPRARPSPGSTGPALRSSFIAPLPPPLRVALLPGHPSHSARAIAPKIRTRHAIPVPYRASVYARMYACKYACFARARCLGNHRATLCTSTRDTRARATRNVQGSGASIGSTMNPTTAAAPQLHPPLPLKLELRGADHRALNVGQTAVEQARTPVPPSASVVLAAPARPVPTFLARLLSTYLLFTYLPTPNPNVHIQHPHNVLWRTLLPPPRTRTRRPAASSIQSITTSRAIYNHPGVQVWVRSQRIRLSLTSLSLSIYFFPISIISSISTSVIGGDSDKRVRRIEVEGGSGDVPRPPRRHRRIGCDRK